MCRFTVGINDTVVFSVNMAVSSFEGSGDGSESIWLERAPATGGAAQQRFNVHIDSTVLDPNAIQLGHLHVGDSVCISFEFTPEEAE